MTYPEFLDRLAQTPRDWVVRLGGAIRRFNTTKGACECPICALHPRYVIAAMPAGLELGLDANIIDIIKAADGMDNYDQQIRAELLTACGLVTDGAS